MKFESSHRRSAKLQTSLPVDISEKAGANPPHFVPDPFAIRVREHKEPVKLPALAASALRGDKKAKPPVTNDELLEYLKKMLPSK